MVKAFEEIDFSKWRRAEQEEAHRELSVILGITPYSDMTDDDLSKSLGQLAAVIRTRDSAIVVKQDWISFGTDTIVVPEG